MMQVRWRTVRTACAATSVLYVVACGADTGVPVPTVLSAAHDRPSNVEYSPDGTRVSYLVPGPGGFNDLYVADADMSDPELLYTGVGDSDFPWSPDGRDIAVTATDFNLWAVPVDGSAPRRLTDGPGIEVPFQYHPDGSRLISLVALDGLKLMDLDLTTLTSREITLNGESAMGLWSPDGTRMAYVPDILDVDATLWVADGEGNGATRLTTPGDRVGAIAWSPDGRHLAYESSRTGWEDLWIAGVDDGEPRQLTRDIRADREPQWSPDGRWIAFLSDRGRQTDVWLVSVESGAEIRVTDDADVETNLRWRPGSSELKYEVETRRGSVWALSPDGTSERRLTADTSGLAAVALSPTGAEVVYEIERGGGAMDLMLVSTSGGDPRPLVADGHFNRAPAWSPDGSRVAFVSNRAGSTDVWLVSAQGGEPRRLTDDPGSEASPRWSHDGSVIYYVSNRDAQLANVWSVSPTGGDPNPMTTDGNINALATIPGRADLLLGVIDSRSGAFHVRLLAPDGAVRPIWNQGNAVPGYNQPGGDLVSVVQIADGGAMASLVSLTSGEAREIIGGADINDWSPDGRRFVYTTGDNPQDLAIFSIADSTVQRLTDTPEQDEGNAQWSSDGQTITFRRSRATRSVITLDVGRLIGR